MTITKPGNTNWQSMGAIVATCIAVGSIVYALGWGNRATVSQIDALNTLVATTAQSAKNLNDATNANLSVVNSRLGALEDNLKERRAEALADQQARDRNIDKRFGDVNTQYVALAEKIQTLNIGLERLEATSCFISAQLSPSHNSADCARGSP